MQPKEGDSSGSLSEYVSERLVEFRDRPIDVQSGGSIEERMSEWPEKVSDLFTLYRVKKLLEEANRLSTSISWEEKVLWLLRPRNYGLYLKRVKKSVVDEMVLGIINPGLFHPRMGSERGGYASKGVYGRVKTGREVLVEQKFMMVVEAVPGSVSEDPLLFYSYHLHQEDNWSGNFLGENRQNLDVYLTSKTEVKSPEALKQMIGDRLVMEHKKARLSF